jgi:rhamnosyltransferase
VSGPVVSVIVRARDEAASIGRCLDLIRGQRLDGHALEVIVVDSGSRDATAQIARRHGAKVIEQPASAFTFGGALNLGCANARGDVLVALSAHAFPRDELWLGRLVEPFGDPRVACASGDAYDPDGARLERRIEQDLGLARRRPEWGYSNAAGAFRADLWRARPFRGDLPFCEDKEWALHWLERGYMCAIDASFVVDHDHTHDPLPVIYTRARLQWEALASFLADEQAYGAPELVTEWWSDLRFYSSPARARLSHRRAARLLGAYAGRRRARRRAAL